MAVAWAMLAETIPLYPLYALFFTATGLSAGEISTLFIVWSTVGIVAEVPCGVLADRLSRRSALVGGGVFQAAGYALWIVLPGFPAFAAGFVLWGLGGALQSGSLEALLYDGLAATGSQLQYPRVKGRVEAAQLFAQVPAAGAATALFYLGGFDLVGWVSVGCCLAAAAMAARLPEAPRAHPPSGGGPGDGDGDEVTPAGYLAMLRDGIAQAATRTAVRTAILATALLMSLDGLEEYFPLLAVQWGVSTTAVPIALLAVPVAGAAGAALGGEASRLCSWWLGVILAVAVGLLAAAGLLARPASIAVVAVFYGMYRMVLVVADARLQQQITGPARATITSVAALGSELAVIALFAMWALGQLVLVAGLGLLIAAVLPAWLRAPGPDRPASH
jgi:MFS family permease